MTKKFNPLKNYKDTKKAIGFIPLSKATRVDYERIGFKSGLEVHQQLKTSEKLFCHCPSGIYHDHDEYNAELIRHMRPTLSELGEYDGTALMEFKTKKEIIYRIHNRTACTYEVDDTPPFQINKEALDIALEISILSKLNIVGEVHITRKQYLDGSIPTGFQRTAILGVEGEIKLKNKKVRLIQLSIEEDSCREISDIGHVRTFKTDRLGMPLIETVTYPDMVTPDELREAAEFIRFLNRSTGKVRTGIGSGREDVNVSCEGGERVEIKGVAHNKWIPKLSHNESFRQYALLNIRKLLEAKVKDSASWHISHFKPSNPEIEFNSPNIIEAVEKGYSVVLINLPQFQGILSHFTQTGKTFAGELSGRLAVIACIGQPNMAHSEELEPSLSSTDQKKVQTFLNSAENDSQLVIWGPEEDIQVALETIEERCKIAFVGVPRETRKSFKDGTTIFERVLPGPDRMYPDTDSPPIPLEEDHIERLGENLPADVSDRFDQMKKWKIPEDTFTYLLSKNMIPLIEQIHDEFGFDPRSVGIFLGHTFKNIEGKMNSHKNFSYKKIYGMFKYIHNNKLEPAIANKMIPVIYEHPDMIFSSVLTSINYKQRSVDEVTAPIEILNAKFREIKYSRRNDVAINWLMGQVRMQALGNVPLKELRNEIEKIIQS